jgi:hypothetical protein
VRGDRRAVGAVARIEVDACDAVRRNAERRTLRHRADAADVTGVDVVEEDEELRRRSVRLRLELVPDRIEDLVRVRHRDDDRRDPHHAQVDLGSARRRIDVEPRHTGWIFARPPGRHLVEDVRDLRCIRRALVRAVGRDRVHDPDLVAGHGRRAVGVGRRSAPRRRASRSRGCRGLRRARDLGQLVDARGRGRGRPRLRAPGRDRGRHGEHQHGDHDRPHGRTVDPGTDGVDARRGTRARPPALPSRRWRDSR